MKKFHLITTLILALVLPSIAESPQKKLTASGWYQRGLAAIKAGKPDQAQTAFENALKLKPNYSPAKYQLGRIPALKLQAKIAKRKALFQTTVIEEIDFQDATFTDALATLNKLATEASEKKFSPNFVVQDSKNQLGERKVTLKMNNIPVSVALNYLLELVDADARYDQFATVIRPSKK